MSVFLNKMLGWFSPTPTLSSLYQRGLAVLAPPCSGEGDAQWRSKLRDILPGVEIVKTGRLYRFRLPDGSITSDEFHSLQLHEWKTDDVTAWTIIGRLGALSSFYIVSKEDGRLSIRKSPNVFHNMQYRKDLKRIVCTLGASTYILDHMNGCIAHHRGYFDIFVRDNAYWGRIGDREERIEFISRSSALSGARILPQLPTKSTAPESESDDLRRLEHQSRRFRSSASGKGPIK